MISHEKQIFLKKAVLFCLIIISSSFLLYNTVLKNYYLNIYPLELGIIVLVTLFSHLKLMNTIQQNARRFSTTFLSVMSVKLFIYLIFILLCLLINRSNAVNFVVTFLILYFIFTIFEVTEISNFLKKNQNSSN